MAVYQISKIQIRRGRANSGTGFPQLASGEMGWAIDTQELYIGNGSVSEGAPSVGNTKILTDRDLYSQENLVTLLRHTYKINDENIQTGANANSPVIRTLQNRLDDTVSLYDFGAWGDGVEDDTAALQRAINQLFLNDAGVSSNDSAVGVRTRVTLIIPAGIYKITSTIYIPSYATIEGAGIDKTKLVYSGTGPAFYLLNSDYFTDPETYSITTTTGSNQAKHIKLVGLTISNTSLTQSIIKMDCVKNSEFNNIKLVGSRELGDNTSTSKGIELNSYGTLYPCENNEFTNLTITNTASGVYSKTNIKNNVFNYGTITNVIYGFSLGLDADIYNISESLGPRNTIISHYKFSSNSHQAVHVHLGYGNTVSDSAIETSGSFEVGSILILCPQIYFHTYGNYANNIISDRHISDILPDLETPYVPVVSGHGKYTYNTSNFSNIDVTEDINPTRLFRLPGKTSATGVPTGTATYEIDYSYTSSHISFNRIGTITIVADFTNYNIHVSDSYDCIGLSNDDSIKLEFSAMLLDEAGFEFIENTGQQAFSIVISYRNTLDNDYGVMTYTYTSIF